MPPWLYTAKWVFSKRVNPFRFLSIHEKIEPYITTGQGTGFMAKSPIIYKMGEKNEQA